MQEEWFIYRHQSGALWPHRVMVFFSTLPLSPILSTLYVLFVFTCWFLSRCEFEYNLLFVSLCSPMLIACRFVPRCEPRLLHSGIWDGLSECRKSRSRRKRRNRKWVDRRFRAHDSVQFISMLMTANENQKNEKTKKRQADGDGLAIR